MARLLELIFPTPLSYGTSTIPTYSTRIVGSGTGWEQRNGNWQSTLVRGDAAMVVKSQGELDELFNFFHVVRGMLEAFQYKDWGDYKSVGAYDDIAFGDQVILASAVGGETTLDLIKTYQEGTYSTVRTITQPVESTVLVGVNGVELIQGVGFTMVDGQVVLTDPLVAGDSVTSGYEYNIPARFDSDELSTSLEAYMLNNTTVPIVEIRVKLT